MNIQIGSQVVTVTTEAQVVAFCQWWKAQGAKS